MKRFTWPFLLAGALIAGGCSSGDDVKGERQDSITWQRDQWDAMGQELFREIEPEDRAESLMAIDAALAAAQWPLKDGQTWTAVQDGKTINAAFRIQEEGPQWELSREWHRLGTEEEETVRYLSIPLKGSLSIDREGRKMGDMSLDLQGEDIDQNGILGLQDDVSLTAQAVADDYSFRFAPCRLSGGEAAFTYVFSARGKDLIRYFFQTHGLQDLSVEKTLEDPYWDESFRYKEFRLKADSIDLEADYPGGIHLRGSIESRKVEELLGQISPGMSEEAVAALVEQASACLHVNWYYEDNLNQPRAVLVMRTTHILNRFDDYWTWEPGILTNSGVSCSLEEFFSGSRFNSSLTDMRSCLQHLSVLMPFLFG